MKREIVQLKNKTQIYNALVDFSAYMFTPLEKHGITYLEYAQKLSQYAEIYVAKEDTDIIGFIAFYCNDLINFTGFLSNIIVRDTYRKNSVGSSLITLFFKRCQECGMHTAMLEVHKNNYIARSFYEKHGFQTVKDAFDDFIYMEKKLINIL